MSEELIRARAPLRIGIAGGGTDVEPYASEKGGCVLNATIDRYAYCTIKPTATKKMSIRSLDYGTYMAPLDGGPLPYDGNMDLIKAVTNHFKITEGFDMFIHSDAPPGSGLGGSSTVMVSIIGAVTEWIGRKMSRYEMADLAFTLERVDIGLKGGKQDQYAAVFGGVNLMEFSKDSVKVNRLEVKDHILDELQYCSLLCYTGNTRSSADIIESQVKKFKERSNEDALDASKELASVTADALRRGEIRRMGELLNEGWEHKKRFSPAVSNNDLDRLYNIATDNGAIGGKVSGAGGGGFMFFICEYDKKHNVAKELQKNGVVVSDFMFESSGMKAWRHKE